ncbi:hypothetical protein SERLA73DRAFT_109321, partial [Serpula lacrymans var. lacrymans S7.3]
LQAERLPYNLLLQRPAREALGIYLTDQIVVIDEAHSEITYSLGDASSFLSSSDELGRFDTHFTGTIEHASYPSHTIHIPTPALHLFPKIPESSLGRPCPPPKASHHISGSGSETHR